MDPITLALAKKNSGGGLPVVELATTLNEKYAALSDEDSAKLAKVVDLGLPIVVKAKVACVNEYAAGGYEYYSVSLIMLREGTLDADGVTEVARQSGFYFVGPLDTVYTMSMRLGTPMAPGKWFGSARMVSMD